MNNERFGIVAAAVVAVVLVGCLTYGCSESNRQWHDLRITCIKAGGSYVQGMCLAAGVEATVCRGGACQ